MKSLLKLSLILLAAAPLFAQSNEELLERVDSLASYPGTDFASRYTFVESGADGSRSKTVADVLRRDDDEKYVIIIEEPSVSRGQGYLKIKDTLWFYDPESRRFNYSSAKDRFQNTSARNSDFTRSTLAQDYGVASSSRVTLGRYDCDLLELEALSDDVTYPACRIWVDRDSLIRKKEDYSLSGQLLRTSVFPSYRPLGDRYVPYQFLVVETLTEKKTQVTIDEVSFDDLPDSTFSKAYLERAGR